MKYTTEQLVNALVKEYEFLCYDDFNPDEDPTPEEYRGHLEYLTLDELIEEASADSLDEYMEAWW